MRIDNLRVQNFKKFAEQDFDLHPRFTLLEGENGSGKTSVLDALAVAAGIWLVEPPASMLANSGRNILLTEIRLEPERRGDRVQFQERRPVIVRAIGQIGGSKSGLHWARQIRRESKSRRTYNDEAQEALTYVKAVYDGDAAGQHVLCPVLAYYGAGRAWLASNERRRKPKPNGPARRWAAFYDCFNERIRFPELQSWFSRETIERGNRGGRWRPGFGAVRRAVLGCVPEAQEIWFDPDREQIVLSIAGNPQPFDNLSAGQRMMLGLVADLAVKAVTQNAFLLPAEELGPEDDPLPRVLAQTPGIVLIDELDVHLHPKWQRQVAADLKRTFPGIQFVCTSHSPQVIGELKPEEIRLLDRDTVRKAERSEGMDSNWILRHVMGSDERDPRVKARLALIESQIADGDYEEARNAIATLRREGWDLPELAVLSTRLEKLEAHAQ